MGFFGNISDAVHRNYDTAVKKPDGKVSGADAKTSGDASLPKDVGPYLNYNSALGTYDVGPIDVITNYSWGINKAIQPYAQKVPSIILEEFQPLNGPMQEMILFGVRSDIEIAQETGEKIKVVAESIGSVVGTYAFSGAAAGAQQLLVECAKTSTSPENRNNAYTKMYTGRKTGNLYTLPYFSTYNHSIESNWGDTDTLGGKLASTFGIGGSEGKPGFGLKDLQSFVSNAYVSIPKRKEYLGVGDVSFETSFQLFNTLADDPISTITKNYLLLYALQFNNMPDKLSFSTLRPSVLYSVEIPGVRYAPAAYISRLIVENIGQVTKMKLKIGDNVFPANIPDAWNVQIVLSEMLPESRNIFQHVIGQGNKVVVIGEQ